MRRKLAAAIPIVLGLAGASAWADPPKITEIRPFGVKKGAPAELTVSGSSLAGTPVLVAPFPCKVETLPNSDGGNFRLKIDVPDAVGIGVYPVRVKTDDGLSNPMLLAVGQVAQVGEAEENSTFEQAQAVPAPIVVEGQCAGTDVDYFKFPGKKGQTIVVDAQCARIGSGVDPQIRLTTAGRKFVEAADDTPGLLTDARFTATLPEDGDYVVEISDSKYQGGGRPIYRLLIGAVPVATEVYPIGGRNGEVLGLELRGGTIDGKALAVAAVEAPPLAEQFVPRLAFGGMDAEIPAPLEVSNLPELREPSDPAAPPIKAAPPVVFNGRIDPAKDEDRFTLAVTPGQSLRIRVVAAEQGSALDGTLAVLAPDGKGLAAAEDSPIPGASKSAAGGPAPLSPDPALDFAVPAGVTEVTLSIRDLIGRGGVGFPYRITVEPIAPGFRLAVNESQLNVPKGGTASVGVTLQRQGFNGPVLLSIPDAPPGLTLRPRTIPAGQAAGTFTVSAAKDAAFGPVVLKVTGTGQGAGAPPPELATKSVVLAAQGTFPVKAIVQNGLPAATMQPLPAALETPADVVKAVHGYNGSIPVKVLRGEKAEGALTFAAAPPLPPNMGVSGTVADAATEGAAVLNTPIESPLGPMVVILTAKGKLGGRDVNLVAPSVAVEVIRPAALELATPAIEVKAGATFELKGKLVRQGPFKEPVKLTLNALPGGLKADPVELAADASEFTLKVVADGGAGEATAEAQLALAFKIGGKDYPFPAIKVAVKVVK